jgi:hypothetical protein
MGKCIMCEKWAGLLSKRISAEVLQRAIAAGINRDAAQGGAHLLRPFLVGRALDARIDPDSDDGRSALEAAEGFFAVKIRECSDYHLGKKGGGLVCRRCFKELAKYVPSLK